MKKIISLFIISVFLFTGCGAREEQKTNAKVNNNENVVKEQTYQTLVMKNVSLIYEDGLSTLSVEVTNTGASKVQINKSDIIFKNTNGSVITVLNDVLGNSIDANTTMEFTITSDIDLSEATILEYDIN